MFLRATLQSTSVYGDTQILETRDALALPFSKLASSRAPLYAVFDTSALRSLVELGNFCIFGEGALEQRGMNVPKLGMLLCSGHRRGKAAACCQGVGQL